MKKCEIAKQWVNILFDECHFELLKSSYELYLTLNILNLFRHE